jgi:hypothetical protein
VSSARQRLPAELGPLPAENLGQGRKFPIVMLIFRRGQTQAPLLLCPRCAPSGRWTEIMIWNLFQCYLSGQHDFGVRCEPGEIYLRCIHCGRRSAGWALRATEQHTGEATTGANRRVAKGAQTARRAASVAASL